MRDNADVATARPAGPLWRVGRRGGEVHFSFIPPDIAADPRLGNRFDVSGAGVLYAATTPVGAFAEVLQDFRPTTAALTAAAGDPGFMAPASVPRDWRAARGLAQFRVVAALPFVDVEQPETHRALTRLLAPQLDALGVARLDVGLMRGGNRLLTRLVAAWVQAAVDPDTDLPLFSGIRYVSKLADFECWAILGGTAIEASASHAIAVGDPDLAAAAARLGLAVH